MLINPKNKKIIVNLLDGYLSKFTLIPTKPSNILLSKSKYLKKFANANLSIANIKVPNRLKK